MEGSERDIVGHLDRIHAHAAERRLEHASRAAETYARREDERPKDAEAVSEGSERDAGAPGSS